MQHESGSDTSKPISKLRLLTHGIGSLVLLVAATQVETPLALLLLVAAFASIGVVVVVGFILPRQRNHH